MSCVVPNCKSHSSRRKNITGGLSFHRFPKNEAVKHEWIQRIGRLHWSPSKKSRICSKHFAPESFTSSASTSTETLKWRRLKETALPEVQSLRESGQPLEMSKTDKITRHAAKRPYGPLLPISGDAPNDSTVLRFQETEHHLQPKSELNPLPEMSHNSQSRGMNSKSTTCVITQKTCGHCGRVLKKPNDIKMTEASYLIKIQCLEKKLERAKLVLRRRLVKINTLQKRVGRLSKKNTDLFNILMERFKEESLEEEYLTIL